MNNKKYQINHALYSSRKRKILLAKAIAAHVRPTHFVTLSLVQGRKIIGRGGMGTWVRGDDVIYASVHLGFIRSVSKRLVNEYAWRAHRPLLRSAYAIEGGRGVKRNHMHIVIEKPDDVPEYKFREMVHRMAANSTWVMNGNNSVDIRFIENIDDAEWASFYSVKDGLERIGMS